MDVTKLSAPSAGLLGSSQPAKLKDAAEQFEAFLIGEMLKSTHESGGGWTGADDATSSSVTDMAEAHLAKALASHGGLGLARLVLHQLGPAAASQAEAVAAGDLTAGAGPNVR